MPADKDEVMSGKEILRGAICDDAVRHLSSGRSVDLQGLPGSGRTLVAQTVAAELEDAGWRVVRACGVLPLRDRPLEALAAAGLVVRTAPGQPGPATALAGAIQGVVSAVRGAATLLVVDDADDLDEASIGAIVAARSQTRFVLLSTSRPAPRSDRTRLTALVQPGLTLTIGPLGFVDLQTLLVETLGGPIASAAVSRVFAGSGGNAGLALAIAESARDHGSLRQIDGIWHAGPDLWSPELSRALDPLLHRLSAPALAGLQALALAGTVDVATARRFLSWEVLEELDGFQLLRFVPRNDEMLVGAYPLAVAEHFRHRVGAGHLRVDEAVTQAFGGAPGARSTPVTAPWPPLDGGSAQSEDAGLDDVVFNRLLLEHWQRELLVRQAEWEQTPTPPTARDLLRALLVAGASPDAVRAVRDGTARIGARRDLVAFDSWYALFLGGAEGDLREASRVLDSTRAEADEWREAVDGIEAFAEFLTDRAADPDDLIHPGTDGMPAEGAEIVGAVRAELLLAKGRTREALDELARIGEPTTAFARGRRSSLAWALLLEGRLDEAEEAARDIMTAARREYDVASIVGSAYVLVTVMLMRGRVTELWSLLGSVLSSGLMPALDRPQYVALLAIAADTALDEDREATARTLAHQALALETSPGPYPLGSPTAAIARLEASGAKAEEARAQVAERLWTETLCLLEHGYTVAAYVCGVLAIVWEPTPERGAALVEAGAAIPAPLMREYDRFVGDLTGGEPDRLVATANHLADVGLVWMATQAYKAALEWLRAGGRAAHALEVLADARRRLSEWGPEATAGLRSAGEAAELTARERQVAHLAASGLSNQDIGRRLHISVRTVENHLNRTFRKLRVDSRTELSQALSD